MQELGGRIRHIRLSRGLSQTELGGGRYSGSYISHIESGRRVPGGEVLKFIAGQLGLGANELDPHDQEVGDAEVAAALAGARRLLAALQWDAAVRAARQASSLAAGMHRDSRCWEADFVLASALMASGRYEQAAECAADLAGRPVVAATDDLRAEARTLAARAYRSCGRLDDAVEQARLAVADAGAEESLLGAALIALLGSLATAARWDEVAPVEARLRDIVDHLDPQDAAKAAWALGSSAFARGDVAQGLAWHGRGAELSDPRVDPRAWARLHQSSAHYLVEADGDLEEAQTHFDLARPIVMLVGNPGDIADLRLVQARLLIRRGQCDQAAELLRHLSAEAAALDDIRLEAEIRQSLATALLGLGRAAEAREQLRAAATCFEKAQAPQRALEMWHRYVAAESSAPTS